jgi:hypothetical protein
VKVTAAEYLAYKALHVHLSEVALIFVRIQQRLDKRSPDIG